MRSTKDTMRESNDHLLAWGLVGHSEVSQLVCVGFFTERQEVRGEVLDLIRISRTEMGAYLCIAQNGVPPSISKRIILTVECK